MAFYFTQLYGLYQDLMNDLKSKSNIKLMKRVLTTYELRKYLKKYFCLTLDNYLVLAYLDVFKMMKVNIL